MGEEGIALSVWQESRGRNTNEYPVDYGLHIDFSISFADNITNLKHKYTHY